jgi:hypothetical protein
MNRDYDDLDHALMALPLEEPPPGLRDSILASTVYAPPPLASPALRTWEIVLIGTLLAVGSWFALAVAQSPSLTGHVAASLDSIVTALADPTTVVWLGCGVTVALGASLFNAFPRRVTIRSGRS